tara:strand:- start:5782 stop:6351 length:570 start_codon:yes stop_codon:yes gene_type:complete
MDPLFRDAKKRWLAEQPQEFLTEYHSRSRELNDGVTHYLEREETLNEEFKITRDLMSSHIDDILKERKKKRQEEKAAEPPKASPPEEANDGPASNGGFVASNDVVNIKWVAENLPNEDAKRGGAPNSAAWGLLCWARRNPDQFYTQIYKQVVIPTKREIEEASDAANDEDRLIEALDRVRSIAGELVGR